MEIIQYPMFVDNYGFILKTENQVLAIDPGDAKSTQEVLAKYNLALTEIWLTHHHHDHCGGIAQLGESLLFENFHGPRFGADILHLPGHTKDHIAFYFKAEKKLFCGDVLFNLGCGRIFDGTYEQMWHSLQIIKALPDDTFVYCAHEYTKANYHFAQSLKMNLLGYEVDYGRPTIPFLLGPQKRFNPFLAADDFQQFKERRDLKNKFNQ